MTLYADYKIIHQHKHLSIVQVEDVYYVVKLDFNAKLAIRVAHHLSAGKQRFGKLGAEGIKQVSKPLTLEEAILLLSKYGGEIEAKL